jgi:hypothetical protein
MHSEQSDVVTSFDLNLYPYKMAVLPKLTVQNKHQRMTFAQNNEVSLNNVWFSDEAHFHLNGVANKQNVWFWASENPRVIHEKVHPAPRTAAWVIISSHGLLWQIFLEETVSSERYLSMLRISFGSHRLAAGLPLQTECFMQAGARLHTAYVVLDFLRDILNRRIISNRFPERFACGQNWPPNSPGLNPRDLLSLRVPQAKGFSEEAANNNAIESTGH